MSNTTEQTLEWETLARAWVNAFPEAKPLNISQVELWINSNFGSLPPDLQSMPRSELIARLLSIQNHLRLPSHSQVSLQPSNNGTTLKVQKDIAKKPAALLSNPLNNIPKDSDLYIAKRNEALRKYEI
ncbi:hypothetical protein Gotri_011291 [Gossypium trilobum]|uniref:Uncharacterized protein n=1 Tax=Gossypium trilobum TaxID=34281 RepID=A0A7J9ETC4_9ROSI|nr:hypothetical protein [Gossypium trilobum]